MFTSIFDMNVSYSHGHISRVTNNGKTKIRDFTQEYVRVLPGLYALVHKGIDVDALHRLERMKKKHGSSH